MNLFLVTETPVDQAALDAYAHALEPVATRYGAGLGNPRFDDDDLAAKLAVVRELRVPIVSVCQGVEAGGHRGTFADVDGWGEVGLLALLRVTRAITDLPLVASGGIADGAGLAAVLAAGARAAQIGTGFMLCPEAGTSAPHRRALKRPGTTALTRAFSGRRARGIVNDFMREHEGQSLSAYPQVNHLTSPLRAAARAADDPEAINLWAGQAYPLAEERPAAELVKLWSAAAG